MSSLLFMWYVLRTCIGKCMQRYISIDEIRTHIACVGKGTCIRSLLV